MFLKSKELQSAATKVLATLDGDILDSLGSSNVSSFVELVANGNELLLNVTNIECYTRIKLVVDNNDDAFTRAVVDAKLFCNLISKVTSEEIELQIKDSYLLIKANGSYKLPLVFDDKGLIELPEIELEEQTAEFTIQSDVLFSILANNSKVMDEDAMKMPVQKLYYLDNKGCITFTTSFCVNNFDLEQPVKLLLNKKLVKLFKLFKDGDVFVKLGQGVASNGVLRTKIRLESGNVIIVAITSTTNDLLDTFPIAAVRNLASKEMTYQCNLEKEVLSQALTRLLLFNASAMGREKSRGYFKFGKDSVTVYNFNKENFEIVPYINSAIECDFSVTLDISSLKSILDASTTDILTFNFGDEHCIVLARGNIKNVIPVMIAED